MARTFWFSLALIALPAQAELRRVQLSVQGMNCAMCPVTVRLALKRIPGVSDVKVTYEPPVAVVTYDDAKTSPGDLMRATAKVGYPSAPGAGQ